MLRRSVRIAAMVGLAMVAGVGGRHLDLRGIASAQEPSARSLKKACKKGSAQDCTELGSRYAAGSGVAKDESLAAALYQQACDHGHAKGCLFLGLLYNSGDGVAKDTDRAGALFEQACVGGQISGCARRAAWLKERCSRGASEACSNLGFLYLEGRGVTRDEESAAHAFDQACSGGVPVGCEKHAELLQRGCEDGHATQCATLGGLYAQGRTVAKDDVRAAELYHRACSYGDASACMELAVAVRQGRGVAKDQARATELYKKACSGGQADGCQSLEQECNREDAGSCFQLAELYTDGRGVPQDPQRAARLFHQSCDAGVAAACKRAAQLDKVARAEKACDRGNAKRCFDLGLAYVNSDGVPKSWEAAAGWFKKACAGGFAPACFNLGVLYDKGEGVPKNDARATQLYRQACAGGFASGCFNVAIFYEFTEEDHARAAQFYKKACHGGFAEACNSLAACYSAGRGVPKSKARAMRYWRKACAGGSGLGCLNAKGGGEVVSCFDPLSGEQVPCPSEGRLP